MNESIYSMKPKKVKKIETPYRKIVTPIPVPESIPILEDLRSYEPRSMLGQPPIVWDRAEGFEVYDKYGNMWLDWSSGVLVASAGHGREEIKKAIMDIVNHGLLHNYCFPSEVRAQLVKKLAKLAPEPLNKVFLLTTGSETIECAIKLARAWGQKIGNKKKIGIISFEGAFHGRTLGAQMVGGIPSLKEWIVNLDPDIHQVPFPGNFKCKDKSFDGFIRYLKDNNITPDKIAAVISETYQGGGVFFVPQNYAQKLAEWCRENKVLLIFDEIQAAFGRTGKIFGFEHYGVTPDIICCGKGISSSLPISAVIGREEIMDLYPTGSMTSTHTGNPVCVAAALANLELIEREKLHLRAAEIGEFFSEKLSKVQDEFSKIIRAVCGKGLVYGLHIAKKGSDSPNTQLAFTIVEKCVEKGVMLFSPVGPGGATIKICPPLTITREAIEDGVVALTEAIRDAVEQ